MSDLDQCEPGGPTGHDVGLDDVDAIEAAWRRERPDLDTRSIGVITRISRLARLFDAHRTDLLARHGTDPATLDLLATLRRAGPPYRLTPSEIAELTLITTGGISQRLNRAEQAKLIRRSSSRRDGRSVIVAMTPRGAALLDAIVTDLFDTERDLMRALDAHALDDLSGVLRVLLADLQNQPRPGRQ